MQSLKRGFSVVEIIVGAAVIAFSVTAILGVFQIYLKVSVRNSNKTQAVSLIGDAGEALHIMRDMSWNTNIAPLLDNTTYYLVWNGSSYEATTTETLIQNKYIRTVILSPIYRDGQDQIVSSGTLDENTRIATIQVTLVDPGTVLKSSETLIHNVYDN